MLRSKDDQIDRLTAKINKLSEDNEILKNKADQILGKADELIVTGNKIKSKLEIVCNDRVIRNDDPNYISVLCVIKNNGKSKKKCKQTTSVYAYKVIRINQKSLNTALATHKTEHPNMKVIKIIEYTPNSINLWVRIRKRLHECDKINGKGCGFNIIGDFTEKKNARIYPKSSRRKEEYRRYINYFFHKQNLICLYNKHIRFDKISSVFNHQKSEPYFFGLVFVIFNNQCCFSPKNDHGSVSHKNSSLNL